MMEHETNNVSVQRDARGLDEERRRFLKKSVFVAYATPVIMSLLVDNANAAKSWNPGKGTIAPKPKKK